MHIYTYYDHNSEFLRNYICMYTLYTCLSTNRIDQLNDTYKNIYNYYFYYFHCVYNTVIGSHIILISVDI